MELPSSEEWARRCAADGEFLIAARYWRGGIRLRVDDDLLLTLSVAAGEVDGSDPRDDGVLEFEGTRDAWGKLLLATPPPMYTDVVAALVRGSDIGRHGPRLLHAQYYGAAMRAIELLRPASADQGSRMPPPTQALEDVMGRYINLELGGDRYRVYFEEAGQGIPLLLQHTAGAHGSQWRHLLVSSEITEHFRLIAYDLPFHGKSMPPEGREWWREPYELTGDFVRRVPVALANALGLDRPVFMGCSVGGLLALDLALHYPDEFRAVISLEGALHIGGEPESSYEFFHPQVSNEYKARLMEGLMSPTSPRAYLKETSFVYSSGWPAAFQGDLFYYRQDFDLRKDARRIDTSKVGVHILSGEYDHSATVAMGRAAHEAIPGSTWQEMKGVGHFPMSENPVAFMAYLKPELDSIRLNGR